MTRMHSSRMRTVRCSGRLGGRGQLSIQGWGLSVQGGHVCVSKGVRVSGGVRGVQRG